MDLAHDLPSILAQAYPPVFPRVDTGRARALGLRSREVAVARGHAVAIDLGIFGPPRFLAALAGQRPDELARIGRRRNTVAHCRRSSYAIGLRLERAGSRRAARQALPAAGHGGAFCPAVAGGGGAVTVSRLPQRAAREPMAEALSGQPGRACAALVLAGEPAR
ncbi:heme-binding protein [Burkholderia glumae]|uniref:Heme-binding protein n=1 Tax=Burkholderia glumae TaxID=337 RepID=A0AAP9Y3S3_BURGL|nr:heme-binding protein [Burkholderia glumae]ACR29056.1 Hypothetical protein bglu_1g19460 [Burkholderia glumae BGR1]AJY67752.1 hypothetical protein KS03_2796 [Burkholderia glumae LMG 2196 = ATCC 33617]KHJ61789.1 hypothetical protein NCPPB3923_16880 [Burkholderia glumae]MCM2483112.1 heme-binding protein [Burkholderia glumae]MCM2506428.1 heme-binding protein [Burkholderia glumae]